MAHPGKIEKIAVGVAGAGRLGGPPMTGRILMLLGVAWLGPAAAQDEPPPVVSLAPGIVARELPVRLTNINNVRYAPDGRLFAVGYDGRVHVLTDTDGDGLEDRVSAYWDRKGELLTPLG